jgi:hypothetical protein
MAGWSKLCSSIVLSTVWREPNHVRIVWVTMLAIAEADGYVGASLPGLADAAHVTLEECGQAITAFLSPDPYSRSKEQEGRRIEVVDRGWRILNYEKFRNERDPAARREQNRLAQQRHRQKERARHADTADRADIADSKPRSAQAEADAEADAEAVRETARTRPPRAKRKREPVSEAPLPEDWKPTEAHRQYAQLHGIDVELEADAMRGWAEGRTAVSWNGTFRTRLANRARWNREGPRNGAPVQRGGLDLEGMKKTPTWLEPGAAS